MIDRFPEYADEPHFVYRAYDRDSRLLYVGCTMDFQRRKTEHLRNSWWSPDVAYWNLQTYDTQRPALEAEEWAIRWESPIYNAMYNGAGLTGWNAERRQSDTCLHGHPWDDNAKVNSQGVRVCRTCEREANRRHDRKRRNTRPSTLARDAERESA